MSQKPVTPCDGLGLEERAARLSHHMIILGDETLLRETFMARERKPGFCVLCGTQLPVTYRAVRCEEPPSEENPKGRFTVAEATHEPATIEKMMQWKAQAVPDQYGWPDGFLLIPVTGCASVDEPTFKRAKELARERHAKIHEKDARPTGRTKQAAPAGDF